MYLNSATYKAAMAAGSAIAVVTGGRSGIGLALAKKIAGFSFIDRVVAISRSIQPSDVQDTPKILPLAADITTQQGRTLIAQTVQNLCCDNRQLRFLVHAAGSIDPIKSILDLKPDELRQSMVLNCEAPLLLTTALYPYMQGNNVAGRVLHVSSGAAHGAPPVGWGAYGITKAAFYQSYKVLEREFREAGGKVVVGSFKPGVVDTDMQGTIRTSDSSAMPAVDSFKNMKDRVQDSVDTSTARPPPNGALDSPFNVAFFGEFLLLGTTDEEFADAKNPSEWDIRDKSLFPRWIPEENLPKEKSDP